MKTPEILHSALRQFRHNNSDEFVAGFDYAETVEIVTRLQEDYDRLLDKLIGLRDNQYAIEEKTGDIIWGECAYEIDQLIEKAAGEK